MTNFRATGRGGLSNSPRTGSAGIRRIRRKAGRKSGTNVADRSSRDTGPGESGSRCSPRAASSCGGLIASSLRDALARCSAKHAADSDYVQVSEPAGHPGAADSDLASAAVDATAVAVCPGSESAESAVRVGGLDPASDAAVLLVVAGSDLAAAAAEPAGVDCPDSGSAAVEHVADHACLVSSLLAAACADPFFRSSHPVAHRRKERIRESERIQQNL